MGVEQSGHEALGHDKYRGVVDIDDALRANVQGRCSLGDCESGTNRPD